MSLARRNRERILAQQQSASAPANMGSGLTTIAQAASSAAERAAAQMQLRLTHDLRRLKEIQSIAAKIAAKREMIGEYAAWVGGLLELGQRESVGVAEDVLPTIMVWAIDTADWSYALRLAEHVLRHEIPLPARYQRAAPALLVEEVAEAALKLQAKGEAFPLDVLEQVEALTVDADMHDEIRAKLMKATGTELARLADATKHGIPAFVAAAERALVPLRRAQDLHGRVGAKMTIQRLQKAIAAAAKEQAALAAQEQAGTAPVA